MFSSPFGFFFIVVYIIKDSIRTRPKRSCNMGKCESTSSITETINTERKKEKRSENIARRTTHTHELKKKKKTKEERRERERWKKLRQPRKRRKMNETSSLCKSFHMIYSYNKDLFLLFDLAVVGWLTG